MRALRLGSYSMAATLAGTPSLFRLKSMMPVLLLVAATAVAGRLAAVAVAPAGGPAWGPSSDFSGRSRVISAKSETVWKRRPGAGGLA